MTVHFLELPINFAPIDMVALTTNRARVRYLAESLSDLYLPAKRERLLSLISELGHVDKAALDTMTLAPNLLATEALEDLLVALNRLKHDPLDEATGKAITEIGLEIRSQLQHSLTGLGDMALGLDNALVNLSQLIFGDVDHLVAPVEAEIALLNAKIETEEKPLAKLLEEEGVVNGLIRDLEAVSLVDRLKPLVESLKQLAEIDPKNPLIGSIKAGIAGMANILNLASEAIKYEHLIRHRERVQQQLDDLRGQARELLAQLHSELRKLAQLKQLKELNEPKGVYSQEIGKLLEALNRFRTLHRAQGIDDPEARATAFIGNAPLLTEYLDELRKNWRS